MTVQPIDFATRWRSCRCPSRRHAPAAIRPVQAARCRTACARPWRRRRRRRPRRILHRAGTAPQPRRMVGHLLREAVDVEAAYAVRRSRTGCPARARRSGRCRRSARRTARRGRPARALSTPSPTATTSQAASAPTVSGSAAWRTPCRESPTRRCGSARRARTAICTSPAPGGGGARDVVQREFTVGEQAARRASIRSVQGPRLEAEPPDRRQSLHPEGKTP